MKNNNNVFLCITRTLGNGKANVCLVIILGGFYSFSFFSSFTIRNIYSTFIYLVSCFSFVFIIQFVFILS